MHLMDLSLIRFYIFHYFQYNVVFMQTTFGRFFVNRLVFSNDTLMIKYLLLSQNNTIHLSMTLFFIYLVQLF